MKLSIFNVVCTLALCQPALSLLPQHRVYRHAIGEQAGAVGLKDPANNDLVTLLQSTLSDIKVYTAAINHTAPLAHRSIADGDIAAQNISSHVQAINSILSNAIRKIPGDAASFNATTANVQDVISATSDIAFEAMGSVSKAVTELGGMPSDLETGLNGLAKLLGSLLSAVIGVIGTIGADIEKYFLPIVWGLLNGVLGSWLGPLVQLLADLLHLN